MLPSDGAGETAMVQRLAELDHEPEVGKVYLVPTVTARWYRRDGAWPVLPPAHEDGKIIDFPYWHYHPDPRFVDERTWRQLKTVVRTSDEMCAGSPVQSNNTINRGGLPALVERRRKCRRPMPDRRWMIAAFGDRGRALVEAHRENTLRPGMICPHKGICLKSMPVMDGVVTCPGHGLRWNVETGALVPPE